MKRYSLLLMVMSAILGVMAGGAPSRVCAPWGCFRTSADDDLAVPRRSSPAKVQLANPPQYSTRGIEVATDLEEAPENFVFALAPNNDLFAIKVRNTTQHKTEVHVLTAASTYRQRGVEVATDLEEAPDNFKFLLGANRDLYAIKVRNTTQHKIEVHVLNVCAPYGAGARGVEIATDLEEAPDNFVFALAPNNDLFAIKVRNTTQHKTEVHVLSAASNYTKRSLDVVSDLEEAPENFKFLLGANRDLYAIKVRNTTQHKTEVHVLSAASNYSQRILDVATDLEEAPDNFVFALAPNYDLFAIKVRNTTQHKTEVHVLLNLGTPRPGPNPTPSAGCGPKGDELSAYGYMLNEEGSLLYFRPQVNGVCTRNLVSVEKAKVVCTTRVSGVCETNYTVYMIVYRK